METSTGENSVRYLLPPERYFRWRGGEITRLEAFCDVVFGFAITLLVVSLEVPRSFEELTAVMRGFLPFAACFAQFTFIWHTHYKFSRRYGLEDVYTVFLNLVLMFLVLFYVYPLKFLFTRLFAGIAGITGLEPMDAHSAAAVMKVYGIGFASVFILFALMYRHAYKLREKLRLTPAEILVTRIAVRESIAMICFGLTSFFVAFKSSGLAGWLYMGIGFFFWIHGSIMGKRVRLLAEKAAAS